MHFQSKSEAETIQFARELIEARFDVLQSKPLIILLTGEMGSGKTRFAKGVAEALGVTGVVSSPSYVLTKEYTGPRGRLIHMDCWRTPEISPEELGLESYLIPGTVVVIEWPRPLESHIDGLEGAEVLKFEISGSTEHREIKEIS